MQTQRTGLALGWKIFWGAVAAVGMIVLLGTAYLAWAFSNTGF